MRCFVLLIASMLIANSATAAGRLCVLKPTKEPPIGEGGAFRGRSDFTPETVRVRVDKGPKRKVSPTEAADFTTLDLVKKHTVSVFTYDGKDRLVSFVITLSNETPTLCMKRKPTYGTWSAEPENETCSCPHDQHALEGEVSARATKRLQ